MFTLGSPALLQLEGYIRLTVASIIWAFTSHIPSYSRRNIALLGRLRGLTVIGMESVAIHIIDDDAGVRASLSSLLRSVSLNPVLHESVRDFLACTERCLPGCIILDVRLPGMSGLEFQSQLDQLGIKQPVIFITGHGDIPMSVQGMKGGAVDFLTKPFRDQDLLDAIGEALRRDRDTREMDSRMASIRRRYELLSLRERQVVALVIEGKMNKQIAGELALSEITVKIHRGSAMRKMQARSLAELVRMIEMLQTRLV